MFVQLVKDNEVLLDIKICGKMKNNYVYFFVFMYLMKDKNNN